MQRTSGILAVVGTSALGWAGTASDPSLPHLESRNGVKQLIVDGKPFLVLGGELRNSSSSSRAYMKSIWPQLGEKKLNTVLAAVTWEMIEPEEGRFDFSSVDGLIEDARSCSMKLIFLWFASWKNGLSSYPPDWVKTNPERFPRAKNHAGKMLDVLSTFGDATRDADAKAFAALMRHIRQVDGEEHTVIMVQVENEVGMRDDSRDRCPAANEAFAQPGKPASVQLYGPDLTQEKRDLFRRQLNWASDECFMAWRYSRHVNKVAAAGKAQYNIPMYANAWLQQPGCPRPGEYPSGGPVPQRGHGLWQLRPAAGDQRITRASGHQLRPGRIRLCGRPHECHIHAEYAGTEYRTSGQLPGKHPGGRPMGARPMAQWG